MLKVIAMGKFLDRFGSSGAQRQTIVETHSLSFASTENKQCKRGIIVKKKVRVMMTMKMPMMFTMTIKMTMTTVLTLGGSTRES